jgi:hypothetical protein
LVAFGASALAAAVAAPLAAADLRVQIINRSGRPADKVYVMLSGGSSSDGQLPNQVGVKLSKLKRSRFTVKSISGRIYFSYGAPVGDAEPPSWPTRYDKVELTYPGVANLTAVDFFGIPFKLQALRGSGKSVGALSWNAPTDTVVNAMLKIPGAKGAVVKDSAGEFVRILSPELSPDNYPSMAPYIASLKGARLSEHGAFFGDPFQRFDYSGVFGGARRTTLTGNLTPMAGPSKPGAALTVAGSTLPRAIYTIDGPYMWGGKTRHVSDNDVYAVIYRDLLAGFAWGYWGGKYGNDSASWRGKPPFAAARKTTSKYAPYNEYAAVVYQYSNAYGFSFSDTGPKQVLLPLDKVATLQITILPDR